MMAHRALHDQRITRGWPGTSSPRHIRGESRRGAGRSRSTGRSCYDLHGQLCCRIRLPSRIPPGPVGGARRALICRGWRVLTGASQVPPGPWRNLWAQMLWGPVAPGSPPRPRSASIRGQVRQCHPRLLLQPGFPVEKSTSPHTGQQGLNMM